MRVTRRPLLAALLPVAVLVTLVAPASGGTSPAKAGLATCVQPTAGIPGSASFVGTMNAGRMTRRMQQRFTLQQRSDSTAPYRRVRVPGLDAWRSSVKGTARFEYTQKIDNLKPGRSYRVKVDFRWLDRNGERTASVTRYSKACVQPGELANLRVTRLRIEPGSVENTAAYLVTVKNLGAGSARKVGLALRFSDKTVIDQRPAAINKLAPGASATVSFAGPTCRTAAVVAVVDPERLIAESDEGDNMRKKSCLVAERVG